MTPDEMAKLPLEIEKMYYELQDRIMSDVVRRLHKTGRITSTADYQLNKVQILGGTTELIESEIKRLGHLTDAEIWSVYDKVIDADYTRMKSIYEQVNSNFIPYEENDTLKQWTESIIEQTKWIFKNISGSMGFRVSIGGGKKAFTPLADYYQKYLDRACLDVVTGSFSYNTVLRRVVKEMTASGIQTVDYDTGYTSRVPVAARRAVLTGVHQMTAKINELVAKDFGTDYYEVTAHAFARPSHAVWQGRVYRYSDLVSVCVLGDVTGLCGANCRHSYMAFIPGVSSRTYTDEYLLELREEDARIRTFRGQEYDGYGASQRQRQYETTMRSQRANIKHLQAGGADATTVQAAQARYLGTLHEYQSFSKQMGLPQQLERVYMDGYGRMSGGRIPTKATFERGITNKKNPKKQEFKVDTNVIQSNEYKRKFNGITGIAEVDSSLHRYAKASLTHRDGTPYEDLYIISSETGKILGKNVTSKEYLGVPPNKNVISAVKNNVGKCIGLHNHPNTIPPTGGDYEAAFKRKYSIGVAVCSDGSVYTYGCSDRFVSARIIDDTIEKYKNKVDESGKKIYNNLIEAHKAALDSLRKDYGIWYEAR